MRSVKVQRWSVLVAFVGLGICGAACSNYYEDAYLRLTDPALATTSTGGTGGGGGAPPDCIPSNISSPVEETCGVFVSASKGKPGNPGTKAKPFATLADAIEGSQGKPIYACAETFTEALALKDDATLYGGLDCTKEWAHVGPAQKTTWTAEADAVPVHVLAGARVAMEDFAIVAADATTAGGSSIALLAEAGTQVGLSQCEVTAGNGAAGADGKVPLGTGTAGVTGNNGTGACIQDVFAPPGSGGQLTCDATNVAGGIGGLGTADMTGGDGSKGQPLVAGGGAGLGQGVNVDCATDGKGGDGASGTLGEPGLGAPMSLGTLDPTGFTGVPGAEGKSGEPGQGGGGGGGGKACANGKAGPSGGGGGSGGCAGAGGKGGGPGGASIGIVSLGAKLTLDTVTLTTHDGGKGGNGGLGQPGGAGGSGGKPGMAEGGANNATACTGGKGGDGGSGGKGGGGRGGHSFAVAYTGDAPDVKGASITTGTPGSGGTGDGDTGKGADGLAAPTQPFD